jgi:hypothetical protein
MRLFLAPAVLLGSLGGFQAINYAAAAPTIQLVAARQDAKTIDISTAHLEVRGLGSVIGKIGKGAGKVIDKMKKPKIGGGFADDGIPGGSASGVVDDVTLGAAKSTRTKGSAEDNLPGIGRDEGTQMPLSTDFSKTGQPEYLNGLVDAGKPWTFVTMYRAPASPGGDFGDEFFKYAVDTDQGALLLRSAFTKLDDEVLDAARTYKTRDILFDGWLRECARTGRDPASLRIVIRNDIQTPETRVAINRAFDVSGKPRNQRAEFNLNSGDMNEQAAFKILTEENVHGVGMAKMLQINSLDVGGKQIVKVTAWTPDSSPPNYFALAFELGNP